MGLIREGIVLWVWLEKELFIVLDSQFGCERAGISEGAAQRCLRRAEDYEG